MLPPPDRFLWTARGAAFVSASLVAAWVALETAASLGIRVGFAVLFGSALLAACLAPVLGLVALAGLQSYRAQAPPGRARTRASWTVGAALAPAAAVAGGLALGVALAVLG